MKKRLTAELAEELQRALKRREKLPSGAEMVEEGAEGIVGQVGGVGGGGRQTAESGGERIGGDIV